MPQILQSSYFSPLQQISMDGNATNWSKKNLENFPTSHQFYIKEKRIDLHVVSTL